MRFINPFAEMIVAMGLVVIFPLILFLIGVNENKTEILRKILEEKYRIIQIEKLRTLGYHKYIPESSTMKEINSKIEAIEEIKK